MRNNDLETIYSKLKSKIGAVGGYCDDKEIPKIIRASRLRPIEVFEKTFSFTDPRKDIMRIWVDEYGNKVEFIGKDLVIKLNRTDLPSYMLVKSDLFHGHNLERVKSNSLVYMSFALSIFDYETEAVIFYGKDEYFRAFFFDGEWEKVSPLIFGVDALRLLMKSTKFKKEMSIDINLIHLEIDMICSKCVIKPV